MRVVKLAPPRARLQKERLDRLAELVRQARRGNVVGMVYAAVGTEFSTWYGSLGTFTREQRMNMIGQLHMLIDKLVEAERDSE